MKLHLGCGARLEPGWINIDAMPCPFPETKSPEAEYLQHDLTTGLPFHGGVATLVYCEHFLEHLTLAEGEKLVRECFRVLAPGGTFRVSVPSLEVLVEKYNAKDLRFAAVVGWLPGSPAQLLNEGFRWWNHQFIFDAPELIRVLEDAGFKNVQRMQYRRSTTHSILLEGRPDLGELIFEGTR